MLSLRRRREIPQPESSPHTRDLEIKLAETRDLEKQLAEKIRECQTLFLNAMDALISALEAKDEYTTGHSQRVSKIAVTIGKELGLNEDELVDLRWASLLHDIGKVAVDQAIQNKPDKLDAEEYIHMRNHVNVAPNIVKWVVNDKVVDMIKHHHDRYNGTGFDQTIRGDRIPLGARIIAVADSYDAMTSERPYRKEMSVSEALAEIERCSGSQFDPVVVRAFLKTIDSHWWDLYSKMV